MKVVIIGAGRLGTQVAEALIPAGHTVTVVDQDDARLAELAVGTDARVVPGDGCEPYVLEEAGTFGADLLVATTGDDEDNLVISLLAKRHFDVPRVAARVNDAENGWLFDERWGVDVKVPSAAPLISLIEEAAGVTDTVGLLRLSHAGVNLIETVIGLESKAAGRPVGEVVLPPGTVVATVIRAGTPVVPDATYVLRAKDEVLVVAQTAEPDDVHRAFQ